MVDKMIVASMVSWIFSLTQDNRVSSNLSAVYLDCLRNILASAGHIEQDGEIRIMELG